MLMYDLIALDMDGTLLTSEKNISGETIESLKRAAMAGKILVLATGRNLVELSDYRNELSFIRYAVCSSGAVVYDLLAGDVICSSFIPKNVADKIMEAARLELLPPGEFGGKTPPYIVTAPGKDVGVDELKCRQRRGILTLATLQTIRK